MANPRLPNITEAEQELLYEKLNIYNQGKVSYKEAGCYLVVLPREGHPNGDLIFYTFWGITTNSTFYILIK